MTQRKNRVIQISDRIRRDSLIDHEPPAALVDRISAARSVWLGTHVDPDGDAIGSTLGLAGILESLGHEVTAACIDPPPADVRFLPGSDKMARTGPGPEHDLAIALDAGDSRRLGELYDPDTWELLETAVIDHHASNPGYARIDWIVPDAASTAELVVRLAEALNVVPDAASATCLLTGIVTDTLGFRTPNTTERTLRAASTLMACGADLATVMHNVFNSRPLPALLLIGRALDGIQTIGDFGIATLSHNDFVELGAEPQQARGISSFLATTADFKAVALLRERIDGRIDVSMRARPGVSLVEAARALGGGGHPLAAGATINGPLEDAVELVTSSLASELELTEQRSEAAP